MRSAFSSSKLQLYMLRGSGLNNPDPFFVFSASTILLQAILRQPRCEPAAVSRHNTKVIQQRTQHSSLPSFRPRCPQQLSCWAYQRGQTINSAVLCQQESQQQRERQGIRKIRNISAHIQHRLYPRVPASKGARAATVVAHISQTSTTIPQPSPARELPAARYDTGQTPIDKAFRPKDASSDNQFYFYFPSQRIARSLLPDNSHTVNPPSPVSSCCWLVLFPAPPSASCCFSILTGCPNLAIA